MKAAVIHPAKPSEGQAARAEAKCDVLTVGHSTRPIEVFLEMLVAHGVTQLVDVRTVPRSRHNPQFSQESLPASLARAGIGYVHAPGLGGFRHAAADSPNAGWRNLSFRGYADYMATAEFSEGLDELLAYASGRRTAIMCAEAVWWRCHRSMISDVLSVRGIEVIHIIDAKHSNPHPYTGPARILDGQLTYLADVGEPLRVD